MIISLIVAVSENNGIGKDNQLLWHLPKDLKFFKNTTWAMPVIMGRKTFESLAGKALPGRLNIVITRQKDWKADSVAVVDSLENAYELAAKADYKEAFVIGGGEIYAQAMKDADQIYLTRVEAQPEADIFFPAMGPEWQLLSDQPHSADPKHQYPFRFQLWKRQP